GLRKSLKADEIFKDSLIAAEKNSYRVIKPENVKSFKLSVESDGGLFLSEAHVRNELRGNMSSFMNPKVIREGEGGSGSAPTPSRYELTVDKDGYFLAKGDISYLRQKRDERLLPSMLSSGNTIIAKNDFAAKWIGATDGGGHVYTMDSRGRPTLGFFGGDGFLQNTYNAGYRTGSWGVGVGAYAVGFGVLGVTGDSRLLDRGTGMMLGLSNKAMIDNGDRIFAGVDTALTLYTLGVGKVEPQESHGAHPHSEPEWRP
ncbi:MAG: hypothetical protein HYY63_05385, partial [Elusimicrobia bacterium]|nr:hypothetical protein [Elusimicrobiota bacterium]